MRRKRGGVLKILEIFKDIHDIRDTRDIQDPQDTPTNNNNLMIAFTYLLWA
jgi:hypothetical protein